MTFKVGRTLSFFESIIFIFVFGGNSLCKSNYKLDKSYKHKIVRHMRIGAFNNLHILILLLSVKALSYQMQQTLVSFYLSHFVSICTFLYLTISILFISFAFSQILCFKSCSRGFL